MFTPQQHAGFNSWANQRIYRACEQVGEAAVRADRSAFFGSIFGTLNHLLLVDILYMDRLRGRKTAFKRLDETICAEFFALRDRQFAMDAEYVDYLGALDARTSAGSVTFTTLLSAAQIWTVPMPIYLTNLFQHQSHHRAQIHNMLSQCGIEPPPIGFVEYCVEEGELPLPAKPAG
jgi:uncharacterized damage-inducible protein DinB